MQLGCVLQGLTSRPLVHAVVHRVGTHMGQPIITVFIELVGGCVLES